jgi:hypothetical protein
MVQIKEGLYYYDYKYPYYRVCLMCPIKKIQYNKLFGVSTFGKELAYEYANNDLIFIKTRSESGFPLHY